MSAPRCLRRRARTIVAVTVIGAFVVAACGDAVLTTPSPEAIETAESIGREVTFVAPVSATPDPSRAGEEPIVIEGRVFGRGSTGVILVHMRTADQTSWYPFAIELAERGDFTVMTFDFRGYGDSTGDKEFDRLDLDLEAAIAFMRERHAPDALYIVGASMGATAAFVAAARRPDIDGIFAISALSDFRYLDPLVALPDVSASIEFVVAEDDVAAARSLDELLQAANGPNSAHVYPGDEHGMALLDGEFGDDLRERILAFLSGGPQQESAGTAP